MTTAAATTPIKVGDTFRFSAAVTDSDGAVLDITDWGIDSQVRRADTKALVATLTVSARDDEAGTYMLEADTDDWPADKRLIWDIRYTIDSRVRHTETRELLCVYAVTQDV